MSLYLVELEGQQPASAGGAVVTLRYATEGYVTGPTESPPDTVYTGRVLSPGSFERHLWSPGATSGAGAGVASAGTIELANNDGGLDSLLDWAFDGRAVTILRGEATWPRSAFALALRGTIAGLDVTERSVTVRIRDRRAEVADKLIVTKRYGGSNVLPDGIDGTASDIKGAPHPLVLGEVENVSPVRVNSSKQIFQLSDVGIAAIVAVYSSGAAVTAGAQRASVGELQNTQPAQGAYDWSLGSATEGAYFRLGSSPGQSLITATVREGATAADRTVAQLVTRVLQRAGVAASDILGASQLNAAQPAVAGFYCPASDTKIGEVLDTLCTSIGAAWTPTRSGQFVLQRLSAPAGAPVQTFGEHELLEIGDTVITVQPTTDTSGSVPYYEVSVEYAVNFTVQSASSVAASVPDSRRDWLGKDVRTEKASDPAVWNPDTSTGRHPLSQPLTVRSYLRAQADAAAEAARLLAVYGAGRRLVSFAVPSVVIACDLGSVISIDTARMALSGRPLLVVGMIEDYSADQTTVIAWG